MKLCEFIRPENIHLRVVACNKTVLLKQLSQLASEAANIPAATIMSAINDREKLGSTGLGSGVAIPHALLGDLRRAVLLVAVLADPCDFEAVDGKPVDLVLFLLVPDPLHTDHVLLLAQAARQLSQPAFANELRRAASANAICELFASDAATKC